MTPSAPSRNRSRSHSKRLYILAGALLAGLTLLIAGTIWLARNDPFLGDPTTRPDASAAADFLKITLPPDARVLASEAGGFQDPYAWWVIETNEDLASVHARLGGGFGALEPSKSDLRAEYLSAAGVGMDVKMLHGLAGEIENGSSVPTRVYLIERPKGLLLVIDWFTM